jgi:putative transposase
MPRYAREKCEKQVYHVMLRGNNRENIFIDEEDKSRIIDTLKYKKEAGEYYLYAYCIMDNHIHLVIREGKDPIARIIKRIAASYSFYFNKKYKRIGHVFQERYKSENIETESYLLTAIRYVHQNPLKSGIGSIEGYKWSSYGDYIEKIRKLTDIEEILGIFSNTREKAIKEFARLNRLFTDELFLDISEEKKISDSNIADYINGYLKEKRLSKNDLKLSDSIPARDELIRHLHVKLNLSLRGIAVILGLNREMVRRSAVSRDLSL